METDELAEYVEQSQTLIHASPQMDEQNTRRKLIEPLIELLGWDMLSPEVELEYSVQMGVGTKKVDYALMLEGTPVVFVEAKGVDSSISDSHRNQLKSYMRQTGVDWGLLTNGVQLELFKRKKDGDRPDEVSLGTFSLQELPDNIHLLRALSKDSIETGEAERIAENIEATQRAASHLQENKESIANQITQVVTGEIGDSVSQTVQDGAKQFVDVLASSLQQQGKDQIRFDWEQRQGTQKGTTSEWTPGKGKMRLQGPFREPNSPEMMIPRLRFSRLGSPVSPFSKRTTLGIRSSKPRSRLRSVLRRRRTKRNPIHRSGQRNRASGRCSLGSRA